MNAASIGILLVALASLSFARLEAAPLYRLTDLGQLSTERDHSEATGINNAGQVVGNSWGLDGNDVDTHMHGFVWTAETGMQDLTPEAPPYHFFNTMAINAGGTVVGIGGTYSASRPSRWTATQGFGPVDPFGPGGYATSINSAGTIVGRLSTGHAFRSPTGTGMQGLGTFAGSPISSSTANGINDDGVIVGYMTIADVGHAFRWTEAEGLQDIGALPGAATIATMATAINQQGTIVGTSFNESGEHAFLWTSTTGMQDLGDLPGGKYGAGATAINASNQVVGHSRAGEKNHAFLWTSTQGMLDLNTLLDDSGDGWILGGATGINDLGQIVGFGTRSDGAKHGFLLTPVPEPRSLLLALSGSLGMLAATRRKWNRQGSRRVRP